MVLPDIQDLIFRMHFPEGELRRYVTSMVYHKNYNPGHNVEKLLPDGTVNLIFELSGNPQSTFDNSTLEPNALFSKSFLSGMQESYITISAGGDAEMLVVQFRPGGSYPMFQLPMSELRDQVIDAEVVLGPEIREIRDRLIEAPTIDQKFRVVGEWLLSRVIVQQVHQAVVGHVTETLGNTPTMGHLDQVVERTGYSHKQMIHLFKRYVGITPKRFQRIIRFNHVLTEVHDSEAINWTRLTYDCGYYDQSHFIREFRHFAGMNPERYLIERGYHANYIPVNT